MHRSFPSHWLRAVLPLAVMHVLAKEATYGYEIAASLKESGFGDIKGGTLYPLLARLERDELVSPQWRAGESGPGRKYYELTEQGRAQLDEQTQQWREFSQIVTAHFAHNKEKSA